MTPDEILPYQITVQVLTIIGAAWTWWLALSKAPPRVKAHRWYWDGFFLFALTVAQLFVLRLIWTTIDLSFWEVALAITGIAFLALASAGAFYSSRRYMRLAIVQEREKSVARYQELQAELDRIENKEIDR